MIFLLRKFRYITSWLLLALFVLVFCITPAAVSAPARSELLNDRAVDMVGAAPLMVRGLAVPAGLTGRGEIIGLADSGLDIGSMDDVHPDLESTPGQMPKVVLLKSWAGREVADDPIGHGTHMATTIAGTGKASDGRYRGVAPGASVYVQGLLDENGKLAVPTDLRSIFWPAYSAGVRVHVNGWGGGKNEYGTSTVKIDRFVREYPDFLPIFGAGNNGPESGTLTAEANSKNALVVGAGQVPRPSFSPDAQQAGEAASFSSRGPTSDGRIKPDLMAPGSAVISACSRLTESNFPADQNYTRMGGTSMAAAVTGGASALLCEYLESEGIKQASAVLLKTLLINGSRVPTGKKEAFGFGELDIAGTILALKERTVSYIDDWYGLAEGDTAEYRFRVTDTRLPVAVTLAWTDPASSSREGGNKLVNDLDLVVETPGGKQYTGNHWLGIKGTDHHNNVEQIRITEPVAGEYVVRVKADRVVENTLRGSATPMQDFALAFGQNLATNTVFAGERETIHLIDGDTVPLQDKKVELVVDGQARSWGSYSILPGSDVYIGEKTVYIFSRSWHSGGVQVLPTSRGLQFLEINQEVRAGGFYLDAAAARDLSSWVKINGQSVRGVEQIPAGVEVHAAVSPSRQTLWQVKTGYDKRDGVVSRVDLEQKELQLEGNSQSYRLAPWAAFSFVDEVVDTGLDDAPYGTAEPTELERIMPGMPVTLWLSPETGEIQYITVQRQVAQGQLTTVDPSLAQVVLETGSTYRLFPGAPVSRDGQQASLRELQAGEYLKALLLPDSNQALYLQAQSRVLYGQVIYISEKHRQLYLTDHTNRFQMLDITPATRVFRWNLPVDTGSVSPGKWVRVILAPDEDKVTRIDIAETAAEEIGTLTGYNHRERTLTIDGVGKYKVGRTTLVSKCGYAVGPEDLVAGETLELVTLSLPWPGRGFPVLVTAEPRRDAGEPSIAATARELDGVLVVQGRTSGQRVYLYRQDGSRETLQVESGGSFSRLLPLLPGEKSLQLAAVDTRDGGIAGLKVEVTEYSAPGQEAGHGFNDIAEHRGHEAIEKLASRGIIGGYNDGTFRPQQPVTRLELAVMLVKAAGWDENGTEKTIGSMSHKRLQAFRDEDGIPAWARSMIAAAREQGLVIGYPDGTFRPHQLATRSEAAVMFDRLHDPGQDETEETSYQDFQEVPWWARPAVSRGSSSGILSILSDFLPTRFLPHRAVTRGEAAMMLDQVMGN